MARTKDFDPNIILDRTIDLFWERGYEKTSVQDLVNHLGIGRGSLYNAFGDKHSLFLAQKQMAPSERHYNGPWLLGVRRR